MNLPDIIVVGAGALGWACAEALGEAGARVTLVDPGGSSASAVAAGMLAPALESVLERADARRADLYRTARDLWPALARRRGLPLDRQGALWMGLDAASIGEALERLGFDRQADPAGVYTGDDWRMDPTTALNSLPGSVRRARGRVGAAGPGWVELADGERLNAEQVVLATGAARPPAGAAAAVHRAVSPVKGQIARLSGLAAPSRILRAPGVYIVPSAAGGVLVGSTMEPGLDDTRVDPAVIAELIERAARLWPAVREASGRAGRAGVRGSTPDGLPLVGPVAPGLSVALAPRRNGWLLAPLVGRMIAAYAAGTDPGPYAEALDPSRFQPS